MLLCAYNLWYIYIVILPSGQIFVELCYSESMVNGFNCISCRMNSHSRCVIINYYVCYLLYVYVTRDRLCKIFVYNIYIENKNELL